MHHIFQLETSRSLLFNARKKLQFGRHCVRDPSNQPMTDDLLPKWALRPPGTPSGILQLAPPHFRCTVCISNPDISWEPFHARLVPSPSTPSALAAAIRVDHARGVLAPRGGANNACDSTKPYPDSCTLTLSLARDPRHPRALLTAYPATAAEEARKEEVLHLVVCLEQRSWTWEVRVAADGMPARAG
jgi:hypothetical protein